jgi:uncharacterized protein (DUF488 family)
VTPKITTIGVYGYSEDDFFAALRDAGVDTFCDIRRRRGMRGSLYAFANSARLQERLGEMGIRYLHFKELAPTEEIRDLERQAEKKTRTAKRKKTMLSEAFVSAYTAQILGHFDTGAFMAKLGPDVRVISLFCVEGAPEACHRSLLAERLGSDLGVKVEHIKP